MIAFNTFRRLYYKKNCKYSYCDYGRFLTKFQKVKLRAMKIAKSFRIGHVILKA